MILNILNKEIKETKKRRKNSLYSSFGSLIFL